MVTVTDDAKVLLARIRDNALDDTAPGTRRDRLCLRMISRDEVLGVAIDSPRDGDQVVDYNGKPLLLIGPDLDRKLGGATIEARQTPDGEKLTLLRQSAS